MNREALPLILALLTPIVIVLLVLLYFYEYDFTMWLRKIPLIYYIIIFPFVLGLIVAFVHIRKKR